MTETSVEQVLVVPTELLRRLGYFQGFCRDVERYLETLFDPRHVRYLPRGAVETDPSFKQLIPYLLLCHAGAGGTEVFCYTRGSGQGEGRLHRKRSVGIGGHISTLDAAEHLSGNPYLEGMRRELDEEVEIASPYSIRCVGLLNDDQTEVGRVHLGVVHVVDLERPDVRPREADLLDCGFRPARDLLDELDGFETWSQIALEAIFR